MNFSRQHPASKSADGDLMDLVGDYLARNREKSYIDMDDMVDNLQTRSYRFSRMKKQTFTALVKRAYNRYVQMQQQPVVNPDNNNGYGSYQDFGGNEEFQSNNITQAQPAMPARADSRGVSSESDIEIVDVDQLESQSSKRPKLQEESTNRPVASSRTQVSESSSSSKKQDGPEKRSPPKLAPIYSPEERGTGTVPVETKKRGLKRKAREEGLEGRPISGESSSSIGGSRKQKKYFSVEVSGVGSFEDFAGAERVIEEICQLLMHLKHPEVYKRLGVTPPRGFLLHGPPGCGKTLLANAIAGELKLPMLKVAATELISGISGESEGNIRDLFLQATDLAPCIIFIDEIDSITPKRETAQREMERRIVAQMLACIDELSTKEKGDQVVLIGATNRIETIDSALRRAGRFDREISIGIPDESARRKILQVICKNLKLKPGFDFSLLAKLTPGYVGADLQALAREAAIHAINQVLNPQTLTVPHKTQDNQTKPLEEPEVTTIDVTGTISETVPTENPPKTEEATKDKAESDEEKPGTSAVSSTSGDTSTEPEAIIIVDGPPTPENPIGPNGPSGPMEVDSSEPPVVDIDEDSLGLYDNIIQSPNPGAALTVPKIEEVKPPSQWLMDISPVGEEQLSKIYVDMDHFRKALKHVQPSSKREGFATVPDTTWEDIGALKEIRDELQVSILGPVKYSEAFQSLGINNPAGVLLCGPPGCGKTLLAKAVANEAGINFISVKGPELLNMYVGESERAVRQCFLRAKNSSPCVIFFDELDALCPRRSDGADSNSSSRVVNQLLTEMDGVEGRLGVYIMAATNRPDIIDPAILRPGRLDKILFVNVPTKEDRIDILKTITKEGTKPVLSEDVNIGEVAENPSCDNYTGADLAALVREASIAAFRELILRPHLNKEPVPPTSDLKVSKRHFEAAFLKIKPSVSQKDLKKYDAMKEKYATLSSN